MLDEHLRGLLVEDCPKAPGHLAATLRDAARDRCEPVSLIMMSDALSENIVLRADAAGTYHVLSRSASVGTMLDAIRELTGIAGKDRESVPINAAVERPAVDGETVRAAYLSDREKEILCCLANGDSNKGIARQLDIAEATVKVHVKTILRKLHLLNRTQAAIWALHHGVESEPRLPDPPEEA